MTTTIDALVLICFVAACQRTDPQRPGPTGPTGPTPVADAPAAAGPCAEAHAELLRLRSTASRSAPTTMDRADLAALVAGAEPFSDAWEPLARAAIDPARVAFAEELADLASRQDEPGEYAIHLLERRFETGIEGPFLQTLDAVYLARLDSASRSNAPPGDVEWTAANRLAKHLRRHPQPLVQRCVIGWASGHGRTWPARMVLAEMGAFVGKPLDEVIAIVGGAPDTRDATSATWAVSSPRHVNPYLRVVLSDGIVREAVAGMR